jgi:hypothetical protein
VRSMEGLRTPWQSSWSVFLTKSRQNLDPVSKKINCGHVPVSQNISLIGYRITRNTGGLKTPWQSSWTVFLTKSRQNLDPVSKSINCGHLEHQLIWKMNSKKYRRIEDTMAVFLGVSS